MKDSHIVVIANGELQPSETLIKILDCAAMVIAADGGANALAALGRCPDMLIGDMDSVSPELLGTLEQRGCRIERYPRAKDETDTELALLEAVHQGAGHITLLGALGGRIDHALANLLLLAMPELADCAATLYDGRSWTRLVRGHTVIKGSAGDLLSLIPLAGDALGVRTAGLQYPLHGETLRLGPARGISNVLLGDTAQVWVASGMLLLVHTPLDDKNG